MHEWELCLSIELSSMHFMDKSLLGTNQNKKKTRKRGWSETLENVSAIERLHF